MGEKGWEELLTHRGRLRVAFATERGEVTQIVIVQYEAEIGGRWRPLVRYDMAHGFLHRDVIGPDGTEEKLKIPYANLGEALQEALEELHRQWEFYRRVYEERMK